MGMLAQMSTLIFRSSRAFIDILPLRYHVGRHVANLQVTNTYEGEHIVSNQVILSLPNLSINQEPT